MRAEEIMQRFDRRRMVGQLVRLARVTSHMTRAEFARAIGVTQSSVRRYERGVMCPMADVRVSIAQVSRGAVTVEQLDAAAHSFSLTYRNQEQEAG